MDTGKYFKRHSVIPVVVKEKGTGKVLHISFMNRAALDRTVATGEVWYCSRSTQKLWKKSSESAQKLASIYADCDNDALMIKVYQKGMACHKGRSSCFHHKVWPEPIGGTDDISE